MASTKPDTDAPKANGTKKWDNNAERDLCLCIIMGNSEGDKPRTDWSTTHTMMTALGYDFSKDAMWYVSLTSPSQASTCN